MVTSYTTGLAGVYGTGNYGFVFCGFCAWIFFTIQILLTMVRRAFWNFFAYTHLLLACIAIVFACIHHYHVLLHLSASLFLYFIDYAFRKISFLIPAKIIDMKPMAGGITRVEIHSFLSRFAKPGQYVFIYFPQASLFGRNPFSISSKTGIDTFTLHIKGMKGKCLPTFTNQLQKFATKVEEGQKNPFFIRIEGPYGNPSIRLDNYKVLMLVSGGIGITPNASMLQHMLKKIKEGKLPNLEKVYFVWSTRTIESLEWFRELFEECAQEEKIELKLCLSKAPKEDFDSKIPYIQGRPQYSEIMSEIHENHPSVKYFGCGACGPGAMVSKVETLCWSNSFNSIKRQWHFHKESFLL